MRSQNSRRLTGSTPAVGSSRKSSGGSWIVAHASATRCFQPPESVPGELLAGARVRPVLLEDLVDARARGARASTP